QKAEYFFGMHSGLIHLSCAFDIKTIVIINFPKPDELYLPCLKDSNVFDIEWLPPQACYLHEDGDGRFAKFLTKKNIEKAFLGELYPYWDLSVIKQFDKFILDSGLSIC